MPHIKYFGGIPPGSITEHVQFDDPEALCFKGRMESRVVVNRRCEDAGIPRTEWDKQYLQHILVSPYEGMSHIGGVGIAADDRLRPFDVAITVEEYDVLKATILAANEAYRRRQIESLEAQNDHGRRAEPHDEALGWRTRVWLVSYTELKHHVPYRVDDSCHAYLRVRRYAPNGMTLQLLDIYRAFEGEVGAAIFDGLERSERLADLLALAGFGAASVVEVVGTSPPFCHEGIPFRVAAFRARIVNSSVAVSPEALEAARVDGSTHLPLRHLREGLASERPTAALASFWNSLERMADSEARQNGWKRVVRCRKCGDEREAGWDIKRGFQAMYANGGVEADFDEQRALRGRVQHGDAIFSHSSPEDFLTQVVRLQSAAIASVGRRIGLLPQVGEYLRTGTPVTVFDCVTSGDTCKIDVHSLQVGAAPSILPVRASNNRGRRFEAGLELPVQVDPLLLPPVSTT